jgi:hypothetical protein
MKPQQQRAPSPQQLRAAAASAFARRNRVVLDSVRAPLPGEVALSPQEARLLYGLLRSGEVLR